MSDFDAFMEDMFLGCAFAAFVEEAAKASGPPCPDATRQRAYRYYEQQLAEKQGRFHGKDRPPSECQSTDKTQSRVMEAI